MCCPRQAIKLRVFEKSRSQVERIKIATYFWDMIFMVIKPVYLQLPRVVMRIS